MQPHDCHTFQVAGHTTTNCTSSSRRTRGDAVLAATRPPRGRRRPNSPWCHSTGPLHVASCWIYPDFTLSIHQAVTTLFEPRAKLGSLARARMALLCGAAASTSHGGLRYRAERCGDEVPRRARCPAWLCVPLPVSWRPVHPVIHMHVALCCRGTSGLAAVPAAPCLRAALPRPLPLRPGADARALVVRWRSGWHAPARWR